MKTIPLIAIIALSSSMPSAARSDSMFGRLFGSNDVAVKVAELSEQFHDVTPTGIAFSPDGRRIAVNSDAENINIWDWRNNRIETTIARPLGFNGGRTANPLIYSPDGILLADSEGPGGEHVVIRIWNTSTWKIAEDITDTGRVFDQALRFTPDGKSLLRIANRGGAPGETLIVHSVVGWQRLWGSQLQSNFDPFSMAVSPDGGFAAIAGVLVFVPADIAQKMQPIRREPTINIIDLRQQKIVRTIQCDAFGPIAWSPEGDRIAIAGNWFVELYSTRTGERLVHEKLEDSTHMNVQFTPDRRYFVETDMNGKGTGLGARIWDGQHLKLLQEIKGNIASMSITQDSKYVALGGHGRTTVWEFKAVELAH
jgi:WD40 repeat protein